MDSYTNSIIFLCLWPVFILVSYLFVRLNIKHFRKLERLEELEQLYAKKDGGPHSGD